MPLPVVRKRKLLEKGDDGPGRLKRDTESSVLDAGGSKVKVVVRIRPENAQEVEGNFKTVVQIMNEYVLVFDPKEQAIPNYALRKRPRDLRKRASKDMKFAFDYIFGPGSRNHELYEQTTKTILDGFLNGYNCSVFAYGATGAGKTFTVLGNKDEPGVIYHTMVDLYHRIVSLQHEKTCEVAVSYLEVYNEQIRDLLMLGSPLPIREDPNSGVLVPGLSLHKPKSAEELLFMLHHGNQNRTQHPTDANSESSRSHAVFQVFVRQRDRTANVSAEVKVAKMCLVDLAGSERATATSNKGARFREGANINKSLLALGNVINALAENKNKGHIPYRDSKLTRLLKDSLGGNCQTVMIAAISLSLTVNDLMSLPPIHCPQHLNQQTCVSPDMHQHVSSKVFGDLSHFGGVLDLVHQDPPHSLSPFMTDIPNNHTNADMLQEKIEQLLVKQIQSPSSMSYEDTYNTLKYADRAKNIKTLLKKNVLNVDFHVARYGQIIQDLRREIGELKDKLRSYEEHKMTVQTCIPLDFKRTSNQACGPCSAEHQTKHVDPVLKSTKPSMWTLFCRAPSQALGPCSAEHQTKYKEKLESGYCQWIQVSLRHLREDIAVKDLKRKMYHKEKLILRLRQLSDSNTDKFIDKLKQNVATWHHQLCSLQECRDRSQSQMTQTQNQVNQLDKEISTQASDNENFIQLISLSQQVQRNQSELARANQLIKYMKRVIRFQEKDTTINERLILQFLALINQQQQVIQGHGLMTSDLEDQYRDLKVKVMGQEVSWADQNMAVDLGQPKFSLSDLLEFPPIASPFPSDSDMSLCSLNEETSSLASSDSNAMETDVQGTSSSSVTGIVADTSPKRVLKLTELPGPIRVNSQGVYHQAVPVASSKLHKEQSGISDSTLVTENQSRGLDSEFAGNTPAAKKALFILQQSKRQQGVQQMHSGQFVNSNCSEKTQNLKSHSSVHGTKLNETFDLCDSEDRMDTMFSTKDSANIEAVTDLKSKSGSMKISYGLQNVSHQTNSQFQQQSCFSANPLVDATLSNNASGPSNSINKPVCSSSPSSLKLGPYHQFHSEQRLDGSHTRNVTNTESKPSCDKIINLKRNVPSTHNIDEHTYVVGQAPVTLSIPIGSSSGNTANAQSITVMKVSPNMYQNTVPNQDSSSGDRSRSDHIMTHDNKGLCASDTGLSYSDAVKTLSHQRKPLHQMNGHEPSTKTCGNGNQFESNTKDPDQTKTEAETFEMKFSQEAKENAKILKQYGLPSLVEEVKSVPSRVKYHPPSYMQSTKAVRQKQQSPGSLRLPWQEIGPLRIALDKKSGKNSFATNKERFAQRRRSKSMSNLSNPRWQN
ncbi:hypothetical protein CHS0354_016017 [Potamilus streckersoni]|uniref:Kinesin motor domain-containing protein n=1 Tax=Potamilus streckersoni TaxID=2493646 RepID=A0AAE0VEX2_9BIVA|nr:hypothetical protein CHS0354_016017 [Potamilus streckersoni]